MTPEKKSFKAKHEHEERQNNTVKLCVFGDVCALIVTDKKIECCNFGSIKDWTFLIAASNLISNAPSPPKKRRGLKSAKFC